MKKAAVLGLAAFYLLLTTGTFVCMVYCSAQNMAGKPAMNIACTDSNRPHHKKDCANGNNHRRCYKHGDYIIKENIKPGSEFKTVPVVVLVNFRWRHLFSVELPLNTDYSMAAVNAPPCKSGKNISIQLHSLLI